LNDLDIDVNMIFIRNLRKQDGETRMGLIWIRIGISGGFLYTKIMNILNSI
jgi:hypothetical protein